MPKTCRLAEPGSRPKLVRPSEEMKRLSLALSDELLRWPEVKVRPMFGLQAFFRGKRIFALVPGKRAPGSPDGIAFKRWTTEGDGRGHWLVFRIEEEGGFADAVLLMKRAYAQAGYRKGRARRGSVSRVKRKG